MFIRLILMVMTVWALTGCQSQSETKEAAGPATASTGPQKDSAPAESESPSSAPAIRVVELPQDVLGLWRQLPPETELLFFSQSPMLAPVHPQLQKRANALATSEETAQHRGETRFFAPDPSLLATNTVRIALETGIFGGVTWIFPSQTETENLSLEVFKKQLSESGMLTPEEVASLRFNNGVLKGQVAGKPFIAEPLSLLDTVRQPALLHIDLSYLAAQYRNDVQTPAYGLIHDLASRLRPLLKDLRATTLSLSTEEGEVPLGMRFMGQRLAELLETPRMLDSDPPTNWRLHADILYRNSLMQTDYPLDAYLNLLNTHPEDAAATYGLYQAYRAVKLGDKALDTLDRAVRLDSGYAYEYLLLSEIAYEAGELQSARKMLELARPYFASHYFIDYFNAQLLLEQGNNDRARELLAQMKAHSWSSVHHAEIPDLLQEFEQKLMVQDSINLLRSFSETQ